MLVPLSLFSEGSARARLQKLLVDERVTRPRATQTGHPLEGTGPCQGRTFIGTHRYTSIRHHSAPLLPFRTAVTGSLLPLPDVLPGKREGVHPYVRSSIYCLLNRGKPRNSGVIPREHSGVFEPLECSQNSTRREQAEHYTDDERVILADAIRRCCATGPCFSPPPLVIHRFRDPRAGDAYVLVLPTVVVGYQVLGDTIVVQAADIIRSQ